MGGEGGINECWMEGRCGVMECGGRAWVSMHLKALLVQAYMHLYCKCLPASLPGSQRGEKDEASGDDNGDGHTPLTTQRL